MAITYEDLDMWEQLMVDRAGVLTRSEVLGLLNDFNIPIVHLPDLHRALHAAGLHDHTVWQAERCREIADALTAGLDAARELPSSGVFREAEGGTLRFDMHPDDPSGSVSVALFVKMFEAAEQAMSHYATGWERLQADKRTDIARRGNRLRINRYRFWNALLHFWLNILARPTGITLDPYNNHQPRGALIEFIRVASAHCVQAEQCTPLAIRSFIRTYNKS